MTIITITRPARCKDCVLLKSLGFRKKSVCDNPESKEFEKNRSKKDLVCNNWKFQ